MEASDLDGAVRVWQAANIARGKHPSPERVARVVQKLQEPTAVPYVAASDTGILGMALLEPCRADDGAGVVVPDALHLSVDRRLGGEFRYSGRAEVVYLGASE